MSGRKVALVTGASRGIGRGIATKLAGDGYDVALVSRSADLLEEAAAACRAGDARTVALAADLRAPEAADAVVAACVAALGGLDLLVNNAGATKRGDFFDLTEADWQDGFALKFFGYVRTTRAAWPHLAARRGVVVNVIGAAARNPSPDFTIGGAVNAGIANFTKAMAGRGLRDGVRVVAVHPGPVNTERLGAWIRQMAADQGVSEDEAARRMADTLAVNRIGTVDDIASVVAFLASDAAGLVHGAILDLDGGLTKGL